MSLRPILLRRSRRNFVDELRNKDPESGPDKKGQNEVEKKGLPEVSRLLRDCDETGRSDRLREDMKLVAAQQLATQSPPSEPAPLVRPEGAAESKPDGKKESLQEVSEAARHYCDYEKPNQPGEGEKCLADQQLAVLNVPSERADRFRPESRGESELKAEQKGLPEDSQCLTDLNDRARADRLGQDGKLVTDQQLALDTVAREPAVSVKPEDERKPEVAVQEKGLPQVSEPLPDVYESCIRNRLSEDEKLFVVQQLAMYRTPSETAALVKEKFGKDASRQAMRRYSPEARRVGKKWREIFDTTRQKYLQEIADMGVADAVYRLRILQECLDHEKSKPVPDRRIIYRIIAHAAFESAGRPPLERGDLTRDFQFFSFDKGTNKCL